MPSKFKILRFVEGKKEPGKKLQIQDLASYQKI